MTKQRRGPGSNAASQRERILARLRHGGWVTGKDFREPAIDGHPEIANITPRISELGKVHYIISERGEDGCARYRLGDVGDVVPIKHLVEEAREAARSADAADGLRLFEPPSPAPSPAPPPLNAALTDWDDAA